VTLFAGEILRQQIPHVAERCYQKGTGPGERLEDCESVQIKIAQVQPVDDVLRHLSRSAVRSKPLPRVLRDQSVLVDEGKAV